MIDEFPHEREECVGDKFVVSGEGTVVGDCVHEGVEGDAIFEDGHGFKI